MKTFTLVAIIVSSVASDSFALDAGNEVFMLRQELQNQRQSRNSEPVILQPSGDQDFAEYELKRANDREELKDALAPYFRYKDEFERLYPYKKPKEPKYSSNPDDDEKNIALGKDYDSRLARWKLRMKTREEAHPSSTPIQPIVTKQLVTDTDKEIAFKAEVEKSRQKTIEYFPDAGQENHPIHAKAAEMWKTLEKQNSPLINDSSAPFLVYSIAAAELGIKPSK